MVNQTNKPIKTYRAGSVSLSLWENELEEGVRVKAFTFQKAYKDEKEKWQNTTTLRVDDLYKLKALLERAYDDQISIED
jgi:hypothetical protein